MIEMMSLTRTLEIRSETILVVSSKEIDCGEIIKDLQKKKIICNVFDEFRDERLVKTWKFLPGLSRLKLVNLGVTIRKEEALKDLRRLGYLPGGSKELLFVIKYFSEIGTSARDFPQICAIGGKAWLDYGDFPCFSVAIRSLKVSESGSWDLRNRYEDEGVGADFFIVVKQIQ